MKLKGHRNVVRAESLSSVMVTHAGESPRIEKVETDQPLVAVSNPVSVDDSVDRAIEEEAAKAPAIRRSLENSQCFSRYTTEMSQAQIISKRSQVRGSGPLLSNGESLGSPSLLPTPCDKFIRISAIGAAMRIGEMAECFTGLRRAESMPNITMSTKTAAPFKAVLRDEEYLPDQIFSKPLKLRKMAKPITYDEKKAGELASKVVENINDAGTCMLISLAHQLGLFAVMAKLNDRPRSIKSIAKIANGLNPRYVQELLAALTCVGIIEESTHATGSSSSMVDHSTGLNLPWMSTKPSTGVPSAGPAAGHTGRAQTPTEGTSNGTDQYQPLTKSTRTKYLLPKEHALYLTWGNGSDNLALLTQYVPVLGRIEDEVVACFRSGEGLDWTRFGQFDLVSELDTQQTIGDVVSFEDEILGMVPGFRDALVSGTSVLCLGSGVGLSFASIAKAFPKSWFTIYEGNNQKAEAAATMHESIPNLHFAALSARSKAWNSCSMLENRTYTGALVLDASIIRDAPDPDELLQRVHGALRPGASLIMLEYVTGCGNAAPLLAGMSALQSVPLGISAGGPALGRCWGATAAAKALSQVGFNKVEVHPRRGDDINRVVIATTACEK